MQKLTARKCKRVRKNIKLKDLPFGAEKKSFVPGNGPQEAWSPKRRCKLTRTCVYHNSRRSLKGGRVRIEPVPDYAIDRLLKRGQGSRDQGRAPSNHPNGTYWTRNQRNGDDLTGLAQHPTIFPGRNRMLMNSAPTKERGNLRRSWGRAPLLLAILALSLIAADTPTTVGTADEQRFLTDVKSLTAPTMEGRGDGAKGLTRAAHLIEQRYKSLGLEPAGKHGFFQPFDVITGRHLRSGNRLQQAPHLEDLSVEHRSYKLLEEFIPLSFSSSGSLDAPLVFAGYGITAPESSYDDYQGLDVKGKIVLALPAFGFAWQLPTAPSSRPVR